MGSFGHSWEESLCLFGQEFLDAASAEVEKLLGPRSESPAGQSAPPELGPDSTGTQGVRPHSAP
ncbi:hypothetical protein [Streptomyces diastaticus]|uniref:hypothetical protein n=1 Tax=Streptomyces diastaticus TaxID=1956 RepID=UPI0037D4C295